MPPCESLPGLIAFWDFQNPSDGGYLSHGPEAIRLKSRGGVVPHAAEGCFGPGAAAFGNGAWLESPRSECPSLDLRGPDAQVSVVAWIKRAPSPAGEENLCQAIAGMWNEHGKRQYCLFLNLTLLGGHNRVCAHISSIGTATPGHKYCMDAGIGGTEVPLDDWQTAALSYDGVHTRAWLDGTLDANGSQNPYAYPGGIFDGGTDGSDFTVGAVARPEKVELIDGRSVGTGTVQSNLFHGLLGGLAIFNRALDEREMALLAGLPARYSPSNSISK